MAKKKLVLIIVSVSLAVIIAVVGCLFFFTNLFKPSVESVLGYKDKNITKITVTKYDKTFELTDKAGIDELLSLLDGAVVTEEEEIKNTFGAGPSPILTLYDASGKIVQFDMFGTMIRRYDETVTQMDNRKNYKRTALTLDITIESSVRDGIITKYIPEFANVSSNSPFVDNQQNGSDGTQGETNTNPQDNILSGENN